MGLLSRILEKLSKPLPKWEDSMSDGCSTPPGLQNIFFTPEQHVCCVIHDSKYYVGGSIKDKLTADLDFRNCLIAHGMNQAQADSAFVAVAIGGQPEFQVPNVSWAFGGKRFKYTDKPARTK